jgi:hypothetical protein
MTHVPRASLRLAAAIVAALALAAPAMAAATEADSLEAFRVLSERNMFVKNRRRPEPPRATSRESYTRPAAPNPDEGIVLRGIARGADTFVAFFENVRTGETSRVAAGSRVGRGVVRSVTLDAVTYDAGAEEPLKVTVGRTLTGMEAAQAASGRRVVSVTQTPASQAAEAEGPAQPGSPLQMILEAVGAMRGGPPGGGPPPEGGAPMQAAITVTGGQGEVSVVPGQGMITVMPGPNGTTVTGQITNTSAPQPSATRGPSGGSSGGSEADILERMRQRREQELRR